MLHFCANSVLPVLVENEWHCREELFLSSSLCQGFSNWDPTGNSTYGYKCDSYFSEGLSDESVLVYIISVYCILFLWRSSMIAPVTPHLYESINASSETLPSSSTYSPLWSGPPTDLLTISLITACINKVFNITVKKFQLTGLKREGRSPLSVEGRQLEGWQVHHPSDHRSLIMVVNICHPSCISMLSSISRLGWMASFLPQLGVHWFRVAYWDVHVIRRPTSLCVIVWLALVYHHLNHCPGTQSWQNTKNWNTIIPQC